MELKEGMYIRNSNGKIEKIKRLVKQNNPMFKYTINCTPRFVTDIKKASFDLIDLIEVGDYVNDHLISEVIDDEEGYDICYLDGGCFYAIDEINDIVTKEQFESMKYVVERDK